MVKMPFEKKQPLPSSEISKLIDKGAPVKEDIEAESKKWTNINLRIPTEMIKEIDGEVEKNIGVSRTGWILQALQKQLKRSKQQDQ